MAQRPGSPGHKPLAHGPRPTAHGPRPTARGPRPTASTAKARGAATLTSTPTPTLRRGCAFFHEANHAKRVPDAARRAAVQRYVHGKDLPTLRKELVASGGTLQVAFAEVNAGTREELTLQLGEHFFLSSVEAAQAGAL